MPQVAELAWHVQGDIGGIGISRLRFTRQDAGSITGADVNAAMAASKGLFIAAGNNTPSVVSWVPQAQVNIYDVVTGLVQGPLVATSLPTSVVGSGGTAFGAGLGARMNWKTATLSGRRLLKGATFFVPMTSGSFSGSGAVASSVITSLNTAAATYLTAMTTATLYPVIWHRPPKGTHTGGVTGIVFAGTTSNVPAGLRSRRS
jgi:hypothetical protein